MKFSSPTNTARTFDKIEDTEDFKKVADVVEFSSLRRIEVTEAEAGLHEKSEGIILRPIYRISWHRKPARIFKLWSLRSKVRSGKFVKLPLDDIILPKEVGYNYTGGGKKQGVNEKAVFLGTSLADTSLSAIFAIRTTESWLMLHRWQTSWTELGLCRLSVCCF